MAFLSTICLFPLHILDDRLQKYLSNKYIHIVIYKKIQIYEQSAPVKIETPLVRLFKTCIDFNSQRYKNVNFSSQTKTGY